MLVFGGMISTPTLSAATTAIINAGQRLYSKGWVPATSGNFSMRLGEPDIAVTVSGTDKGALQNDDVMSVNLEGQSACGKKASAELELHLQLYHRDPDIGAVLHTHSANAVVVSKRAKAECRFDNLEILKAFSGVSSHDATLRIPVFENTQNIAALAADVEQHMNAHGTGRGYLIRGHGLYTWGATMDECMRHLEALEYLLEIYRLSDGQPEK